MSPFWKILISVIITTIIYFAIWRVVIAVFRAKVINLIYYYNWIRIDREVERFVLPVRDDNVCDGVIILGPDGKDVKLGISTLEVLKILKQRQQLFDFYEIDETRYDCVPTEKFSYVANRLKGYIIKTTNRLHERWECFPKYVQDQLYGANNMLVEIKQKVGE